MPEGKIFRITWNGRCLELGKRTLVMGVLNVTPDSFSDGGRFYAVDRAVSHGLRLAEEGADILDVGGESTRPYAAPVSAEEEILRVTPVIEALSARLPIPISIDTMKAKVARRSIEAGASMINDIGALRQDPEMAGVAAEYRVPIILMHMKGTPRTMQLDPFYADVVREIKEFLGSAVEKGAAAGISKEKIIVDPGIGFGKTAAHNLTLLSRLPEFRDLDVPILVGPSRKAFIRHVLKTPGGEELPPDHPSIENGTQAAVAAAVLGGAHIVRVHDVARTLTTVRILDAIQQKATEPKPGALPEGCRRLR